MSSPPSPPPPPSPPFPSSSSPGTCRTLPSTGEEAAERSGIAEAETADADADAVDAAEAGRRCDMIALAARQHPVGTRFVKEFPGHGFYEGVVRSYDGDFYSVHYPEDGDTEDLEEWELDDLVMFGRNREEAAAVLLPSQPPTLRTGRKRSRASSVVTPSPTAKARRTTKCFAPLCPGNFDDLKDTKIHTLILGTYPSKTSLRKQQSRRASSPDSGKEEYYASVRNYFWWIAGDCLGFRRSSGRTVGGDDADDGEGDDNNCYYYKHCEHLRYGEDHVVPYEEQERALVGAGFALWDLIASCTNSDSRDVNIRNEVPNDVRSFVAHHPSIRTIVLANGKSGLRLFNKHFADWWESGDLVPYEGSGTTSSCGLDGGDAPRRVDHPKSDAVVTCISAISLSQSETTHSYTEKRDFWDEHVFRPGLRYHKELSSSPVTTRPHTTDPRGRVEEEDHTLSNAHVPCSSNCPVVML